MIKENEKQISKENVEIRLDPKFEEEYQKALLLIKELKQFYEKGALKNESLFRL